MIERFRGVLFFLACVAALGALALFEARQPQPLPLAPASLPSTLPPPPTPTPGPLRVYVSGAVQRPDVYELPPGTIVRDAVVAAGGATSEGDLERLNLALPLHDADQVHVPRVGQSEGSLPPAAGQPDRINVNTADVAALDGLPGIGPELAQRIIDYRQAHGPFAGVEDLVNVPGIGPSIVDKIRDLIRTN